MTCGPNALLNMRHSQVFSVSLDTALLGKCRIGLLTSADRVGIIHRPDEPSSYAPDPPLETRRRSCSAMYSAGVASAPTVPRHAYVIMRIDRFPFPMDLGALRTNTSLSS